jgi:hypothetical protein
MKHPKPETPPLLLAATGTRAIMAVRKRALRRER